ncbi:PTS system glucose-specific IIC component [Clostridium tetanomorphum]|uniref:PTS transporter subunit EIIC n=1 Tax=Clostridium tetanomorphum TaxID=1553 RepID=UPI00044B5F72|nr:PTS transporter subunit EIIC [Clostridium tetanomorphum]KAJ53440.1 PTS system, glucose-like IIB component [Clostridium tetanomorphum DSM 665]MBP1865331.1 PTS system glucose-specific IIC component [Clostridium tetanomorphum]NRS85254.1 PTS system glucose-specific IIC component [Clostridium tetanomorphum]SQC03036.1 PTS system transporter subunit IIABC [Clostridium tetanomorphum]
MANKTFKTLQRVGKAVMTPVSVLPAAGILVALGRWFMQGEGFIDIVGQIIYNGGLAVFVNLSLIFAIGVAIGFTGNVGVAGLASAVGYGVLTSVLKVMGNIQNIQAKGIENIDMGVFGGIIIGVLSAQMYEKFHETKLPPYLGFFAGKRLVPIVTAAASILIGIVFAFIWPPIQSGINTFATFATGSALGPGIYAAGKRALIPVGLHHVFYPPFLYEFGRFLDPATGTVLKGEAARYFAGDPTAGYFMASEFPIMLFGLPAATLAMYLRSKKEKRKAIAGMMLTAAVTSILTGITEPIEFSFIFVAPLLYIFHVLGAFISGLLTKALEIRLGYSFSASLIDYVLGITNSQNGWKLFLIVGPIIALLYFIVFYYGIKIFNYKTPGREEEIESENKDKIENLDKTSKAAKVLEALGGSENIDAIDACITRLRLTVNDTSKVDKSRLKSLGAAGTMDAGGGNIQVVFGTEAEMLKDEIKKLM